MFTKQSKEPKLFRVLWYCKHLSDKLGWRQEFPNAGAIASNKGAKLEGMGSRPLREGR